MCPQDRSEWLWGPGGADTLSQTNLFEQIPDSHQTANDQTNKVLGVELIVDNFWRKMEKRVIKDH